MDGHIAAPRTAHTPLLFPALLFDWLIAFTHTLTIFDNIILDKSAGSKSGLHVDLHRGTQDCVHSTFIMFDWLITLTLTLFDNITLEKSAVSKSGVYVDFYR